MAEYTREAEALAEAYDRAVGEALALGVPTHRPGSGPGRAKALGDLRAEIGEARRAQEG